MRWICLISLVVFALVAQALPGHAATVNTGEDGSVCAPFVWGQGTYPGLETGVSTTALGADAPAYYEVGGPTGAFAGQRPKGVMIVIHGGGWYRVGKNIVAASRDRANRWRDAGWATVNIDYRACAQSLGDVLWFMRRIRSLNPYGTICATGNSAGAHLALLLASVRQDLACVMAYGAPSALFAIRAQTAVDAVTGAQQNDGPKYVSNLARAAFGTSLAAWNPISYAAKVTARVLLASSDADPLVPAQQNVGYAAAVRAGHPNGYVDLTLLPSGETPFVHAGISSAARDHLMAHEDALVAPLTRV